MSRPSNADRRREADFRVALLDEKNAAIAELEAIIRSRDGDIRRTFDSLGVAVARIAEMEAELVALRDENQRLFVSLKGKHVREQLYHALKDLDELAARERGEE